jgi:L-ascorbate metabolism protein UlaG (beta-lactamase superfamily)
MQRTFPDVIHRCGGTPGTRGDRIAEIAMKQRKISTLAASLLAIATMAAGCRSAPAPAIAPDGGAGAAAPAGGVEVMYVANEGVLISAGDERVLIDGLHREYRAAYPFLPEPHRSAIESAQAPFDGVDIVLVSHRHLDHFHPESVGRHLVNARDAVLVSSAQVVGEVEAQFADFASVRSRVTAVTPSVGARTTTRVSGIDLVVLGVGHGSGRHADVQNLGHLVTMGGRKFLHLGDASTEDRTIFEKLRLHQDGIDVAFLPIWFLTEADGQAIVRDFIRPREIVAVHMPAGDATEAIARAGRAFPTAAFFRTLLERRRY